MHWFQEFQAGHIVTHPTTGRLEWTVLAVSEETGIARVVSTPLGRRQEQEFPIHSLEIVGSMSARRIRAVGRGEPTVEDASHLEYEGPDSLSPELQLVDEADDPLLLLELLDLVVFCEDCLQYYRREFEPKIPGPEIAKRLHRELRNHGRLLKRDPNEYLRIRTPRFDVSLPRRPTEDDPLVVERIQPSKRWLAQQRRAA